MSKAAIYIIMTLMLMSIALATTPTIDNLYIEPPQALNNDTLEAICNASDTDLDPITYDYNWWVNENPIETTLVNPTDYYLKINSVNPVTSIKTTSRTYTVGDIIFPLSYNPSVQTSCNTGICGINYRIQACGYTYQRSVGIFHTNYGISAWSNSGSFPFNIPESCLNENRQFTVTMQAQFATISGAPYAYVQTSGTMGYTTGDGKFLYPNSINTYDNVTIQCSATAGGETTSQNFTTTILAEIPSCIPSWVCDGYNDCGITDEATCNNVYDDNACGEAYTGDYSEFTPMTCDYCIPEAVNNTPSAWSEVGVCLITDEQEQERTITDYDNNSCYATTGLATDIFTPTTYTETQYIFCDYCTPSWTCTGYEECVSPATEASCNQVNDTNICGESYTGNYSEFTPQNCTYSSGSSGGASWPETTEEEELIFSTNIEPENETEATTLSILNIGGSNNLFSSFSKEKADEFFEEKIKPNAWLIGIILLMTMSISGIAINKSKNKLKRKNK